MTDRAAIQVGDLVQVVRPTYCCGYDKNVGKVATVSRLPRPTQRCPSCRHIATASDSVVLSDDLCYERSRLKRIPPLSELEGERTQEAIKQPMVEFKTKVWTGKEPA